MNFSEMIKRVDVSMPTLCVILEDFARDVLDEDMTGREEEIVDFLTDRFDEYVDMEKDVFGKLNAIAEVLGGR